MQINVVDSCTCPECGGEEVLKGGPVRPFKVLITNKQGWLSNCTACRIWFDKKGNVTERN